MAQSNEGLSVEERRLLNDDADQMTTLPVSCRRRRRQSVSLLILKPHRFGVVSSLSGIL